MALQTINIGASANDGSGDPLRTAMDKINDNFGVEGTGVFNVTHPDYGAVGNGSNDDLSAIQSAVDAASAAGGGVVVFPKPSNYYKITGAINMHSNVRLLGLGVRPTIKLIKTGSSHIINCSSNSNAWVENLTLDGTKSTVTSGNCIRFDTCTGGGAKDCHIKDSKAQGVYILDSSVGVEVSSCDFSGTEGIALSMDTSTYLKIFKNDFTGGSSFCIFGYDVHDSQIEGNSTNDSVLELIGLRYNCSRNRVINNHAYDTDDNGISITGYSNTVTGNVCRNNGGSGIWVYGSNNTVTGNNCSNNGQDYVNRAGILVEGGSGGEGKNNTVQGNICFDDQGSPTQKWGVRLGTHGYTTWANAQSIVIDDYRIHGNNAYVAMSAGTTATGSEPVHTSGTVAGADTIQWKFLFTTSTSFHPTNNDVSGNVAFGNITADYSDGATSGTNTHRVLGHQTVTGNLTVPMVIGGTGTTSTLTLQSTSGVGTTGADIIFKVGNNGATEAMRILNSGNVGINQSAPDSQLHIVRTNSANPTNILALQNSATATDTAARMNFVLSTSASATLAYIEGRRTNSPAGQATAIIFASHDGSSLAERMRMTPKGVLSINATITAGGTTGNQTINKMAGSVNIAAGQSTITVTNDNVGTTTLVYAAIATNDTTAVLKNVVSGAGSFVITLSANATAETKINWFIIAPQ